MKLSPTQLGVLRWLAGEPNASYGYNAHLTRESLRRRGLVERVPRPFGSRDPDWLVTQAGRATLCWARGEHPAQTAPADGQPLYFLVELTVDGAFMLTRQVLREQDIAPMVVTWREKTWPGHAVTTTVRPVLVASGWGLTP